MRYTQLIASNIYLLLGTKLGVGGRTTHLVFSLLDVHITATTGIASFVSRVTRDTLLYWM